MKILNRYEAWWPVRIVLDENYSTPQLFKKQIGNSDKDEIRVVKECIVRMQNEQIHEKDENGWLLDIKRNMTKSRIHIYEQILNGFTNINQKQRTTELIKKLNLWENRDFASLFVVKRDFTDLPFKWQQEKEIALIAIRREPSTFQLLSRELRMDKEVIMTAVKLNGDLLRYVCATIEREMVFTAFSALIPIKYCGLYWIIGKMADDRDIVMAAVKSDGQALKNAYEYQNDREIVTTAVQHNGCAIQYASFELQLDTEIVLTAVKQNPDAYFLATFECQTDPEIMEAAGITEDMGILF
ncbi:hypothetical protein NAEGRDRAFT_79884 [Naegleria gruberi]|uniref:DUF4116 domain-containing protein n=1 Tax=Naegleria gruberi TaxID=5762 RepID=D2VGE3_NAEGR|nr:uncharacterized protein NAEGRDRAFT_79884 [Naegleria gruberi]EFC43952.1 hypothetical protein NAEGRDRAFT_79884 [Naegleria gruberi]|eukprot:XP_002676696.1 hypothetical protein NAEGRDRAFT_79884 [Naegleria gruberi strain NEG-M]